MESNKKVAKITITQKRGMEGVGDFEHEWLTPEESKQRWAERNEYIEKCKKEGTYGQEYSFNISAEYDSVLDKPSQSGGVSFSTLIWDVSKQ